MTRFGKFLVCGVAALTLTGIGVASAKIMAGTETMPARSVLERVETFTTDAEDAPIFDEEFVADRVIVFFEPGSAALTPEALETLSMFSEFVRNTGYSGLVVKGHVAEDEDDGAADLSHRRAMSVLTALVDSGLRIDEHKRFSIVVDGESAPPPDLVPPVSDDDGLMNAAERRVDVIVRRDTPPFPISAATTSGIRPVGAVMRDADWFDRP